jgi:SulP family sulfate permease
MGKLSNIFPDLVNYNFDKFKSDLGAGIVTGIVAIPLSLALAIATGVPPVWGLYTAAIAGMIAAVFAGSRYSVSGPAAAIVPVLSAIILKYGIEAMPSIALVTGIALIVISLFKLGNLIKYVPLSVTLGFTAGIAVLIFFGQVNKFLGLSGIEDHPHFHADFMETLKHLYTISWPTALLGFISLGIMLAIPKLKYISKIPASLPVAILAILASQYIPFFDSVNTIKDAYNEIPLGLPMLTLPDIDTMFKVLPSGLQLAFLICIESLLCAVVADKMTKTKHSSNQELFSQGLANIATAFFSGISATAVIARTGTSIKNGARTRVASFVHAVFVLIFILVLAPVGSLIPLTTLSAILFITAWKISEHKEIGKIIDNAPRNDVLILLLTFLLTVFLDLTVAVGVGVFLAALLIFKNLSTLNAEELHEDSDYASEDLQKFLHKNHNLKLLNLEGNLTMGSAHSMSELFTVEEDTKYIVFRMREIHYIDISGLEALESTIHGLKQKGIKVYLTSVNTRLKKPLDKFGILDEVDQIFKSTEEMITSFKA